MHNDMKPFQPDPKHLITGITSSEDTPSLMRVYSCPALNSETGGGASHRCLHSTSCCKDVN